MLHIHLAFAPTSKPWTVWSWIHYLIWSEQWLLLRNFVLFVGFEIVAYCSYNLVFFRQKKNLHLSEVLVEQPTYQAP